MLVHGLRATTSSAAAQLRRCRRRPNKRVAYPARPGRALLQAAHAAHLCDAPNGPLPLHLAQPLAQSQLMLAALFLALPLSYPRCWPGTCVKRKARLATKGAQHAAKFRPLWVRERLKESKALATPGLTADLLRAPI